MCQAGHTSRVVWTSSSNARRSAFNIEDIQHRKGTEPYSSSKYASDMLSLALNRHKNSQVRLPRTFTFIYKVCAIFSTLMLALFVALSRLISSLLCDRGCSPL